MQNVVVIELAGTPEGKGRPRFRAFTPKGGGRPFATTYTPANTRKYESALRYAAQEAMASRAMLEGPLAMKMIATFPVPQSWSKRKRADALNGLVRPAKKPDADNLMKVLDACNEIVFHDDAQIVDAQISKFYGERPSLRIEVQPIENTMI